MSASFFGLTNAYKTHSTDGLKRYLFELFNCTFSAFSNRYITSISGIVENYEIWGVCKEAVVAYFHIIPETAGMDCVQTRMDY